MILFFGPPGSGKSVQGQMLVEHNGWKWLSTGELFRKTTDKEILERMKSGELVSDDMTNRLVEEALEQFKDTRQIILDGYPRNIVQAQWLLNHLSEHGRQIDAIIVFKVPEAELVSRLDGRGRSEDTTDVIKRRLQIYEEQTHPVVEFYKAKDVPMIIINGIGTVDEVHQRIQKAVEDRHLTAD